MEKEEMDRRIIRIELFEFDVPCCYHHAKGKLENCRYGVLKLTDEGGERGWGECLMSVSEKYFDLVNWARFLYRLQKSTLAQALDTVRLYRVLWGNVRADLVEMALYDLKARSQRKPFVDVLGSFSGFSSFFGSTGRSGNGSFRLETAAARSDGGSWPDTGARGSSRVRQTAGFGHAVADREFPVSGRFHAERELHPGCCGSLLDDLRNACMLRQEGMALAMHKDYLIGPACCLWEHTAEVLGANWLEEGSNPEPARLAPLQACERIAGTGFQLDQQVLFEESRAYFVVL
ncbi:hypothetical protein P4H65_18560 [Paenibacillus chitinolyticus]|uniref:hypothetical protein n=1 Tax=Paenibacillus chitinolyticus TaxID=79263 RepID=UPI002DBDD061|nr:hypothetical protein [Paenibacillus chitinolyticus]MEC0247798.1 hypothetical protein [Paenibacillus chitinolyticus]